MKLNVFDNEYGDFLIKCEDGKFIPNLIMVMLNGEIVKDCIEANEEAGYIVRWDKIQSVTFPEAKQKLFGKVIIYLRLDVAIDWERRAKTPKEQFTDGGYVPVKVPTIKEQFARGGQVQETSNFSDIRSDRQMFPSVKGETRHGMSWSGFNLEGSKESIAEVHRLLGCEARLNYLEANPPRLPLQSEALDTLRNAKSAYLSWWDHSGTEQCMSLERLQNLPK